MNANEIKFLEVKIADVSPFEEYDECPVCNKPTDMIVETNGPLSDWTQCDSCDSWFAPDVIIQSREDNNF